MSAEGDAATGCEVRRVREWLSVRCKGEPRDPATSVTLLRGGHGDALLDVSATYVALMAPVLPGETLEAELGWKTHSHTLRVERPQLALLHVSFGPKKAARISLGLLYAALTAYLGFEVNDGEAKVMGLAAYGQPSRRAELERLLPARSFGPLSTRSRLLLRLRLKMQLAWRATLAQRWCLGACRA